MNYEKTLLGADTPFAITEAFNSLRTNLMYTVTEDQCPVYGVTSSFAGEGKSVLVANLAQSFAQLGKKVILLDCDLRKPTQHRVFQIERNMGVSEILAGICNDPMKTIRHSVAEGLDVVPSGHRPPNPSELLSSPRLGEFLEQLRSQYDMIFLDFPPVGVVVDALMPLQYVSGYLYIVRSGLDEKHFLQESVQSMKRLGANLLGLVLNDVDPKHMGLSNAYRYRRKNYHYNKKYGYHGYGYGRGY